MTAKKLYVEASRRGLRLQQRGQMLAVIPASRCTPGFANVLREHKRELLDFLDARAADLPPDCAPWIYIARQVMEGEFDGADKSTIESLTIGLRNINHPECKRAIARLPENKEKPRP